MADTTTAHYGYIKPDPGGSGGTWDTKLNDNFDGIDTNLYSVSTAADLAATAADNAQATADAALLGALEMGRDAIATSGSSPTLAVSIDLSTGGPVYTIAAASTSSSCDLNITFTNRPVGYDRLIYLHITQTVSGFGSLLEPKVQSASKQWALPLNDDVSTSGTQELANITGNGQVVVPLLIVGS